MRQVGEMLSQIAYNFNTELIGQYVLSYSNIFFVMLIGYVIHWLPYSFKDELRTTFIALPDLTKAIICVAVIILLYQVRSAEVQPFIYFQF
jgi:dolichyl-phosphate-mannose--protein O-mannosyl transferase